MRLQECFKGMVVLIVVLLLFAGCEQTTTPSSSSLSYIPLSVGNWWIFDTRQIDSTGNIVASGYRYFDSTVTVARTIVGGRPTFTLLSFWADTSGQQVRVDTFVVALENETFWLSSRHLLNRLQDLQLPLPEWIPVANFQVPDWRAEILRQHWIDTIDLGKNADFIVDSVAVTALRQGEEAVAFAERSVRALHFLYRVQLFGTLEMLDQRIPMTLDLQMHDWYARGIGVVQARNEFWAQMLQPNGSFRRSFLGGEVQHLLRYAVQDGSNAVSKQTTGEEIR